MPCERSPARFAGSPPHEGENAFSPSRGGDRERGERRGSISPHPYSLFLGTPPVCRSLMPPAHGKRTALQDVSGKWIFSERKLGACAARRHCSSRAGAEYASCERYGEWAARIGLSVSGNAPAASAWSATL